jgi:pyrimidine oxygenase
VELGIFVPIGNNGWIISTNSPQYMPSFELNRSVTLRAEQYGFDFALSMIKLHGFGGKTEFWDHNLESFTLMAGLAAITKRIGIYATAASLTLPPAIVARMATTIDSISGGRFGVNLVTGWQKAEYGQMGLWPGEEHFRNRYAYLAEYTQIMRELWDTGHCDFKGRFFQMDHCVLSPRPQSPVKVICAGQSDAGMEFSARYADINFCIAKGINTPHAVGPTIDRLHAATARIGRKVGAYLLLTCIVDDTDAAAMAKWEYYKAGADEEALAYIAAQAAMDSAPTANVKQIVGAEGAINLNIGTFIGSPASVAHMLDDLASIPGVEGVLLTLDDFREGLDRFGQEVVPRMRCRKAIPAVAWPLC